MHAAPFRELPSDALCAVRCDQTATHALCSRTSLQGVNQNLFVPPIEVSSGSHHRSLSETFALSALIPRDYCESPVLRQPLISPSFCSPPVELSFFFFFFFFKPQPPFPAICSEIKLLPCFSCVQNSSDLPPPLIPLTAQCFPGRAFSIERNSPPFFCYQPLFLGTLPFPPGFSRFPLLSVGSCTLGRLDTQPTVPSPSLGPDSHGGNSLTL